MNETIITNTYNLSMNTTKFSKWIITEFGWSYNMSKQCLDLCINTVDVRVHNYIIYFFMLNILLFACLWIIHAYFYDKIHKKYFRFLLAFTCLINFVYIIYLVFLAWRII